MKIGILSDIHDNIENLLKGFKVFKKNKVKRLIFCGDLCSPFTVGYFKKIGLPVLAVYGNGEGDKLGILRRIERFGLDFNYAPKQGLMWDTMISGKRIGIYHGFQKEVLESLLASDNFDLFFSGHNHQPCIKKLNKTLWLNPGSVCGLTDIDKKPVVASVAVLDLNSSQAKIINL